VIRLSILLPEYLSEQADEALKSEYNLEFLGLKEGVKERELEMKTGLVIIWTIYAEYPYPNRDQELAGITRDMKQLAVEHQLLLIVSSSLARNAEHRFGRSPFSPTSANRG